MKKGMTIEQALKAIEANDWCIGKKESYIMNNVEVVELKVIYKNFRTAIATFENGTLVSVERVSAWF